MGKRLPIFILFILFQTVVFSRVRFGLQVKEEVANDKLSIVVSHVLPGSPAEQYGIHKGDVIIKFNALEIHSLSDMERALDSIKDFSTHEILIDRRGQQMNIKVQVYTPNELTLRVVRRFILEGSLLNNAIYIDSVKMGTVAAGYDKDFVINPNNYGDTLRVFVERAGFLFADRIARGETDVVLKDGYITKLAYGALNDKKLEVSYIPTDEKEKEMDSLSSIASEYRVFQRIVADDSYAPEWFKQNTKETLDKSVSNTWRGNFYSSLIQTTANLRLLALIVLLYPLFCFISFNSNNSTIRSAYLFVVPILLVGVFLLSKIITYLIGLGIYAITGENGYVPFEFVFFSGMSILISGFILLSIRPFYKLISHGETMFKRTLGFIGYGLGIIGTIFTIRDLLKLMGII